MALFYCLSRAIPALAPNDVTGISIAGTPLIAKAVAPVRFCSSRDFELPVVPGTSHGTEHEVPTIAPTRIPVAFVDEAPGQPARLWLDWGELFRLVVGRTVKLPGIEVRRGRP